MGIFRNRIIMKVFVIVAIFVAVLDGRRQPEEPVPMAGCDPDFGWVDGADAYEQGMSWFQAMECCYYNKGYLAEPQNIQENDKIMEYIKVADGMDGGLTAYWLGANDLHREGIFINPSGQPFAFTNWMDLNCTDTIHGAVTHYAVCERIPPA